MALLLTTLLLAGGLGWGGEGTNPADLAGLQAPPRSGRPAAGGRTVTLKLGESYPAGTRVESTPAGISFVVPESFEGGYDLESHGIRLNSKTLRMVIGLYGYSGAQPLQVVQRFAGLVEAAGLRLEPAQAAPGADGTIELHLRGESSQTGTIAIVGLACSGQFGNSLGVFALGTEDLVEQMQAQVRGLVASVRWSDARNPELTEALSGRRLSRSGSNSMNSPGGAAGAGGGLSSSSRTEASIDFCSDGSYAYQSSTESYLSGDFNVEGGMSSMSGSNTSTDGHQGQWSIVSDMAGAKVVFLLTSEDRHFSWPIHEDSNGLVLAGRSYAVSASERCP